MKIEEKFAGDKATIEWLLSQKPSTQATYRKGWRLFTAFTGLMGDQILQDREGDNSAKWERKVLEFKAWVTTQKTQTNDNYSEGASKTFTIGVRSFFAYHRKDLKFRTSEAKKLGEARRKKEDYRFTRENLADMSNIADLQGKYVIIAGKSFGMRIGDFLKLRRGDLEPYLKLTPPISIGELPTEKEGVTQCPFIDTDALPIIQAMIFEINSQGRVRPKETMLTIGETQVNNIVKKLTLRAGINIGNKRVRFHCLRKFLCDHLASHMSESKWKQVVGKKISESAYVSPDDLRKDYERAMSETCFMKAISGDDLELQIAEKVLKSIGLFQKYKLTLREKMSVSEKLKIADEMIEENGKAKTQTNGGCLIGGCSNESFEQIPEANLLEYLRQGYTIVHRLQSGEVIVRR